MITPETPKCESKPNPMAPRGLRSAVELLLLSWISLSSDVLAGTHRRRIKTEEKAKVVAVVWGTYLNTALTI